MLYNFNSIEQSGTGVCSTTEKLREKIHKDVESFISGAMPLTRPCGCGGEELPISICLIQHRLAHQLGSSLLLQDDPVLDGLVLAIGPVLLVCSLLKAFHTLSYVEKSLDTKLDTRKHFIWKIPVGHKILMINYSYVDGVSLTYGSLRQHIWTFANAIDEASADNDRSRCSCTDSSHPNTPPLFVGNEYFCETGVPPGQGWSSGTFFANDSLWDGQGCGPTSTCCTFNNPPWFCKQLPHSTNVDLEVRLGHRVFYADDLLWDGQGCGPTSTCCTFNNPPWFCKQLPQSTNVDLEIRLCSLQDASVENTPIELVEIYVK